MLIWIEKKEGNRKMKLVMMIIYKFIKLMKKITSNNNQQIKTNAYQELLTWIYKLQEKIQNEDIKKMNIKKIVNKQQIILILHKL